MSSEDKTYSVMDQPSLGYKNEKTNLKEIYGPTISADSLIFIVMEQYFTGNYRNNDILQLWILNQVNR